MGRGQKVGRDEVLHGTHHIAEGANAGGLGDASNTREDRETTNNVRERKRKIIPAE